MRALLVSMFLLVPLNLAFGQDADRYSLEKGADGYVRLDKRTGEMSICQDQSGQLICRLAADDRNAFEDEIDRLRSQLDAVEKRVATLEQAGGSKALPSDEEFDRTMSYMQRFFRGFLEIVKEFDNDLRGGGESGDSAPNKT